jgi:hypothetical protein
VGAGRLSRRADRGDAHHRLCAQAGRLRLHHAAPRRAWGPRSSCRNGGRCSR